MIRNNATYWKQPIINIGEFANYDTAALKKGYGMCFDLDYLTTLTDQTATDPFGARGMKTVQIPAATNANRFAGVLMQNYPANPLGKQRMVQLAMPGGCAEVAGRVITTNGVTRMTCIVDSTAGQGLSGLFAYGGLNGRGSAIALQTLAANGATTYGTGNLAISNLAGGATFSYSAATGLTTVTLSAAGTALGYSSVAVDASSYEMTLLDGATAATGATRCTRGVYPVYQAVTADTFTVVGNTGDGAGTICLTKVGLLMLAYLEDGEESGLSEYVTPNNGAARQFVLTQGGTTFIAGGGIAIAGNSTGNTLANPVTIGGLGEGARKAFNVLSTITTSDYIVTVTSGVQASDTTTVMATIVLDTAADEVVLQWHGNTGGSTAGYWTDLMHVAATYT